MKRTTDSGIQCLVLKDQEERDLEKERDELQARLDAREEASRSQVRKEYLRCKILELRRKLDYEG